MSLIRVRTVWALAAISLLAYVAAVIRNSPLPLQDYPTHLARGLILSDLIFHAGQHFGAEFQYRFLPIPYILGDLLMAGATELFGVDRAAALWSVLTFVSLPCALLFYLRTVPIAADAKGLLFLLSLYLSIDWFFLMGFLEFRLGLALLLATLGVVERVRGGPSLGLFIAYMALVSVGYLTHLTYLIFLTAVLSATALMRVYRGVSTVSIEAKLLAPCGVLLAWHFGVAYAFREPTDLVESPYVWGPLHTKVVHLNSEFVRFRSHLDEVLATLMVVSVALYTGPLRWRDLADAAALELVSLAAMMVGLYFVLPRGYVEAFYVDVRALPLAALFALLAVVSLSARGPVDRGRPMLAIAVAAVLVTWNLAYIVRHWQTQTAWLAQYRRIIAAIPSDATVLPIYTHRPDGAVAPNFFAFSFAAIDRGAVIPYLQTGDTGNPQKYLRYRHRPEAPDPWWYAGVVATPRIDWDRVACVYDYVLVTQPFDASRLKLPLRTVTANESAALLAVGPQGSCRNTAARAP